MTVQNKIKIVSDGTPQGSFVVLPNGERMPGMIVAVKWQLSVGEMATAEITFANVEIQADAEIKEASPVSRDQEWMNHE